MPASIATPSVWTLFSLLFFAILAFDLGVLNRRARVIESRLAALQTLFFVSLAGAFALYLWSAFGARSALEFATGYLVEYALSVDNLFVFLVLLRFFATPAEQQHRVLFWGILGAILLRGAFIFAGAALIARFHWTILLFGAFLVWTGAKLVVARETEIDPEANVVVRFVRRLVPVTAEYRGRRFFVREHGRSWATPLFLVLVAVDVIDLVFAVDSIPAIFAVTRDPFLVLSSNLFAILGLRALYFLLASLLGKFRFLKYGLGAVLAFVGMKMLLSEIVPIPIGISLGVIVALLAATIVASRIFPGRSAKVKKEQQ